MHCMSNMCYETRPEFKHTHTKTSNVFYPIFSQLHFPFALRSFCLHLFSFSLSRVFASVCAKAFPNMFVSFLLLDVCVFVHVHVQVVLMCAPLAYNGIVAAENSHIHTHTHDYMTRVVCVVSKRVRGSDMDYFLLFRQTETK